MRAEFFAALLALAPAPLAAQDELNTRERLDVFRHLDADRDGWLSRAEAAKRRETGAGFQKADATRSEDEAAIRK